MANWTATTTTTATPDQILEVLTHPDEIRRWSPIDFDLDELDDARLAARHPCPGDRQGRRRARGLRRGGPLGGPGAARALRRRSDRHRRALRAGARRHGLRGPRVRLAPPRRRPHRPARGQRDRRAALDRRARRRRGPHRPCRRAQHRRRHVRKLRGHDFNQPRRPSHVQRHRFGRSARASQCGGSGTGAHPPLRRRRFSRRGRARRVARDPVR